MGRYEEAYTECKRALRLDPVSAVISWYLAVVYWLARRYDQAIEQLEKIMEFDATFVWAQGVLAWAYLDKAMHEAALSAMLKGAQLLPDSTLYLAGLGETYAVAGRRDEAEKVLNRLHELSSERYVMPYYVARIHAAPNDTDEALRWLEIGYRDHAPWMVFLKLDPRLDNVRPDSRFQDLLCRMNFPEV
jgi:tetratricopeptide (TPR) repeat protein